MRRKAVKGQFISMSRKTCGESEVKLHTFHFLRYKLSITIPPVTVPYDTEIFHPTGFSVADAQGNDRKDTLYMAGRVQLKCDGTR